jgi:hypothetical protein
MEGIDGRFNFIHWQVTLRDLKCCVFCILFFHLIPLKRREIPSNSFNSLVISNQYLLFNC